MKEEITLRISKKDVIKLLERHYQDRLGKPIKISIKTTKECFGLYETEELVTRISFETKEATMDSILGKIEHTITYTLDESDIKEVLSEHLSEKGYEVTSVRYEQYQDYDRGLYGFNGLTAELKSKGMVRKLVQWK